MTAMVMRYPDWTVHLYARYVDRLAIIKWELIGSHFVP